MNYSSEIAQLITDFLEDEEYTFSFEAEDGVFSFGMILPGKLQNIHYLIMVNEDNYVVYTACPINAKDHLPQMAEFICRVNEEIPSGHFSLDFDTGDLSYVTYVNCADQLPSLGIIEDSLYVHGAMYERYGEGIVAVAFGVKKPQKAVADCHKSDLMYLESTDPQ